MKLSDEPMRPIWITLPPWLRRNCPTGIVESFGNHPPTAGAGRPRGSASGMTLRAGSPTPFPARLVPAGSVGSRLKAEINAKFRTSL
jgi:hypothetical protein